MTSSAPNIILASESPRRRELLRGMGVRFEVVAAKVRELSGASSPHLAPAELARENARRKAKAVAGLRPGRWVLGADTVVALERRVMGKPVSIDEARDFLLALSGETHEVVTGCALMTPEGEAEIFHEVSRVTLRVLTYQEIGRYLGEVNVLDKAGGYALQERGDWIVERVEGSRANVIGLPVEALERVLKMRGLL
ncbi:MAG TPA: Maf family protein [Candidatus Methylacidiphilales bacterium]|nr:Maf family protein [Candidatus Methylacidiphilales bacterium]